MKGKRKETKPEEHKQQTEYVPKSIALHTLGVSLVIGAKPNSKQSKVLEINDEYIGVAIAAPAREGQANEQLISHLASVLALKKNMLYLDKGSKSRNKVVIVQNKDISPLEAYHRILADFNS